MPEKTWTCSDCGGTFIWTRIHQHCLVVHQHADGSPACCHQFDVRAREILLNTYGERIEAAG